MIGSSWLRVGSYFHLQIRGRRGLVSFLLEFTNFWYSGFLRFKCRTNSYENCVLRLANLTLMII